MTFHRVTFSSSLMNVWIRKAVILALFCSVCLATESELVYFHSKNFNNTLRWIPAEPAVPGENITYKYSVEYKTHADGAEYQKKPGCQNITVLFCDLTEETSEKPNEHYWGQVLVNGNILGSTKTRFSPLAHTILGEPILSINAKASTLHVHAILPQGPNGESIGDIIARSKNWSPAMKVSYTLKITSPEWAAQKKINDSGQFILELSSKYAAYNICGYVFYKLTQRQGRPQSEEAKFCKEMPGDPLNDQAQNNLPWLLLPAVCLLALVILSFVCMCKYVNVKKVTLPSNLISFTTPIQVLLPQNEIPCVLSVSPQKVKRDSSTVPTKPSMPSASRGGYSPQDLPWQIWQDSSIDTATLSLTSDSEDTSAQSSVSYSAVAPPEPTEDQGAFNDPKNSNKLLFPGAECGSNHGMALVTASHGSPLSVQDSLDSDPSRPLLLHVDSEGKLVLPFWSSQFQSSTGNLQRGPLLSDLINSTMEQPPLPNLDDTELSECGDSMITAATQLSYICVGDSMITAATQMHDSHYTQSQTVIPYLHQGSLNSSSTDDRSESCYKQNWIPEVNSDDDRKTDYPRSWNGLRNEDGEAKEDREELERSQLSEHFLGNWLLQIQD